MSEKNATESSNAPQKTYLGDGAYVDFEEGMVKLTTENGIETTNTIYLERAGYEALVRWVTQNL